MKGVTMGFGYAVRMFFSRRYDSSPRAALTSASFASPTSRPQPLFFFSTFSFWNSQKYRYARAVQ